MQIVFDDGAGRRELDVRVNVPTATVADLAHTLDATGAAAPRPLLIDGRRVDPDLGFREAGLHEGAVVRFASDGDMSAPPSLPSATAGDGTADLVVVNGLDAGRRFRLPAGRTVVGRAPSCEVVLGHGTVSQRHAAVTRSAAGAVSVEDLDSHNGTWLDGSAVTAATDLPAGVPLRVGALELELRPQNTSDRPLNLDPSRHTSAAGTIAFNRPPRTVTPPPGAKVALPQPPRAGGGKGTLSVASIVAPLVVAGASFAIMKSPQYLLFAGLSPIMAVGNAIESRRRGRKTERSDKDRFRRELRELDGRLAESAVAERDRRRVAYPDPVEVMRRVTLPSTTLWERRPDHADFLQLRIGTGDLAWDPPVVEPRGVAPADDVAEALRKASTLERAVVPVELAGGGVVGIVGDRAAALALARSLLCQVAVLHGPADVPTMVLTTPAAGADWDWTKWLPHTRGPSGVDRMLSSRRDLSTRMVEAQLDASGATNGRRRLGSGSGSRSGEARPPQGPTLLVVVDDESLTAGRRAPTRYLLRGDAGPVAGIVIATSADRLPALCTAVITMDGPDGSAHLLLPKLGTRVDALLAGGMSDDTARECARTLAGYEDPELDLVGAGLPGSIRLLPLLDLDPCTPETIRARWARAGPSPTGVAAPIGVTESSVFTVDLVADGPHGLVGGTTGAGKSELLRTMVAGLAAGLDPDHLTFLLIDFKGGSAFDECAKLPHTVGIVTDLDEHLAERALRCLEAELKFRERALRDAGAVDLPDYLRSTAARSATAPPLPRLVVIIDEFATLKAELPQFVDALVGVAQRGRSLGVHLLLATQRPQGAVSENIKANTNLRIALRVQDRSDSTDIIDVADAAAITRTAPGRAYVRLGPGEVAAIQTALSTGARSDEALLPVDVAPFVYGPLPRAPVPPAAVDAAPGDDGETDLAVLVAAISGAFEASGRPPPRRPWPEPLPGDVDLDDVIAAAAAAAGAPVRFVPLAMADDPDAQTQYPTGWVPEHGNLVVYGIGGSGGTTVLTSLALSLARRHSAEDVHLYGLDFGARELGALAPLPHVGAVVTAAERERQTRLVRFLRDELARRRQAGLASVGEEPMLVLLVDGWSALAAEYNDVAGGPALEALQRIVADGPEVRIYTVITADRPNAVPASLASLIRQRLALRLADASAYSLFGIRSTAVPEMVPGRALVGGTGQVIQIARPAGGVAAAAASVAAATPVPARAPRPIRTLGSDISLADLGEDGAAALGARPWTIPVGIAEESLAPASLVVYQGEHALVAGPARSGKTTALLTVAAVCRLGRPDLTVLAVAGPRSALSYDDLVDEVIAPTAIGTDLAARVEAAAAGAGATLLLVDDAEAVDDTGDTLVRLSTSDRADLLVVVAGRNDGVRSGYTHWTRQLRRSKLGILLMPDVDYDADLLGTPIPRRPPVVITPGRGYLVNSGHATLVHLARPG